MKKFLTTIGLALFLTFEGAAFLPKKHVEPTKHIPAHVNRAVDPLPDFNEPHIVFHYYRSDGDYTGYKLWLWDDVYTPEKDYLFKGTDEYGVYLYVPRSEFLGSTHINFIIKRGDWDFQTPDTSIYYADHELDVATNAYHFYLLNHLTTVYKNPAEARANDIYQAFFSGKNSVDVITNNKPKSYELFVDNAAIAAGNTNATYSDYVWNTKITLDPNFNPDFSKNYEIELTFEEDLGKVKRLLSLDGLYDDPYFESEMTYDGHDLGVTYTPAKSTFKAWAPTVSKLVLRIYENGTPVSVRDDIGSDEHASYNFTYTEKGVWVVEVNGDLAGKYYTFVATHPTGDVELTDPYAKSAGINGIRGMIVDFSITNPTGWDAVTYSTKLPTEIVPYELHVADLTSDESWNGNEGNRKKFPGLIEKGTTYTKDGVTVKTGFDHIVELGVNALQIIPFYDQQNDERNPEFNWGYNPQNYDVLEGSYSTDPYDGYNRIREFKEVVKAYAAEDIRIIMDVVYNHVASMGSHSFTRLVPGYYFRHTPDGSPDNSSGVGNVTASERIMMERFMRDSTAFWVREYKIGGFRFDLMGLHTTDAMNAVANAVHAIRDDVLIFGEPWDMDQTKQKKPLATQANIHLAPRVGAFNDQIRDTFVTNAKDPRVGWIQMAGNDVNTKVELKNKLKDGMLGKIWGSQSSPTQTINYAAAHDNYTLYDKLTLAGTSGAYNYELAQLAQQSLQTDSMILLSQGVSFIHAGSEILRSKPNVDPESSLVFDYNSYKSPYSVNSLKWDEKVDNLRVFDNYKALIELKTTIPALQYTTRAAIDENVTFEFGRQLEGDFDDNFIKITFKDSENTYTAYFYGVGARLRLSDLEGLEVVLDTSGELSTGTIIEDRVLFTSNMTLVVKEVKAEVVDPTPDPDPTPTDDKNLTWVYVSGGIVGAGAIGALLFFLLRKKIIKV